MKSVKSWALHLRSELLPRLHPSFPGRSAVCDRDPVLLAPNAREQYCLVEEPIDDVVVAGDSIVRETIACRTSDQKRWRVSRFHSRRHLYVGVRAVIEGADGFPRDVRTADRVAEVEFLLERGQQRGLGASEFREDRPRTSSPARWRRAALSENRIPLLA